MSKALQGATALVETTAGPMTFEFFPDKAPGHVENFLKLAEKGFYDNTIFHRVIKGFMIQGGCPQGTGTGDPGYKIKAEFNDTKHVKGIISMARSQDPNSAGSQFFVCHGDAAFLDKQYTAFGKLAGAESVATLDKIATAPVVSARGENSKPVTPVKVTKVTVKRPAAKA
ncbi:MAG TPA: peptidylprolyl isomerase [Planctomycetota bacterium]|nr:peptidylprolyl isomerase [Planctomycetota bacterium]